MLTLIFSGENSSLITHHCSQRFAIDVAAADDDGCWFTICDDSARLQRRNSDSTAAFDHPALLIDHPAHRSGNRLFRYQHSAVYVAFHQVDGDRTLLDFARERFCQRVELTVIWES